MVRNTHFDRDLENFKRLHVEGAISVGVVITRGSSLQESLLGLVKQFARDRAISSFEHLQTLDLYPTRRQKEEVLRRVNNAKSPQSFDSAWASVFVQDKYGAATTHWRKLQDRVHRGVGNPCPLLLIGLPDSIVSSDQHSEGDLSEVNEPDEADLFYEGQLPLGGPP